MGSIFESFKQAELVEAERMVMLREADDLVLMDVQRPVMGGITATHNIRNLQSGIRDIPIRPTTQTF